jgi:uncharacterized protein YbjT (DUF2867 family)
MCPVIAQRWSLVMAVEAREKDHYVVTGATGRTGSVVADSLLVHGKRVLVIGRNLHKLERFVERGAQPFIPAPTEAEAMRHAFADASVAEVCSHVGTTKRGEYHSDVL